MSNPAPEGEIYFIITDEFTAVSPFPLSKELSSDEVEEVCHLAKGKFFTQGQDKIHKLMGSVKLF